MITRSKQNVQYSKNVWLYIKRIMIRFIYLKLSHKLQTNYKWISEESTLCMLKTKVRLC